MCKIYWLLCLQFQGELDRTSDLSLQTANSCQIKLKLSFIEDKFMPRKIEFMHLDPVDEFKKGFFISSRFNVTWNY